MRHLLDPNEAPEGYVAVLWPTCEGCDMKGTEFCHSSLFPCDSLHRIDGVPVIFKKKVEKPVDPNEAPEGYTAVLYSKNDCQGCDLKSHVPLCWENECTETKRVDQQRVIFQKKVERPHLNGVIDNLMQTWRLNDLDNETKFRIRCALRDMWHNKELNSLPQG